MRAGARIFRLMDETECELEVDVQLLELRAPKFIQEALRQQYEHEYAKRNGPAWRYIEENVSDLEALHCIGLYGVYWNAMIGFMEWLETGTLAHIHDGSPYSHNVTSKLEQSIELYCLAQRFNIAGLQDKCMESIYSIARCFQYYPSFVMMEFVDSNTTASCGLGLFMARMLAWNIEINSCKNQGDCAEIRFCERLWAETGAHRRRHEQTSFGFSPSEPWSQIYSLDDYMSAHFTS